MLKLLFLLWIIGYYQVISMRSYYDFAKHELKSEFGGISQRSYPDKAADFLVKNGVTGHFFNDFNSGAYLLGRTYPDIRVFIDGRTELYGGTFFRKYRDIFEHGNTALFEKAVDKFQISGVFLNSSRQFIPKGILSYLYAHPDWRMVYFDYDAVIFLKNITANKGLIDKFQIDLAQWKVAGMDLFKLGTLHVKPYQPYYRAYTLESLGFNDAAFAELGEAIRADPFYADAHDLMGKIYAKKKDFRKAFEHFRIAVMGSPQGKEMRHNLALVYFDLGEYKGAVTQYEIITTVWPNDPKGYFLLAQAHVMDQNHPEAMAILKKAHLLSPGSVKDFLRLGDVMSEQKAYPEAKQAYEMALEAGQQPEVVYRKLGFLSLEMGDRQRAKEAFLKALSVTPDDEEIKKILEGLN
jgi:tetratricopeptide (TPR) repeat protein